MGGSRRSRGSAALFGAGFALLLGTAGPAAEAEDGASIRSAAAASVRQGDAAFAQRAAQRGSGDRVDPGRVRLAMAAYRAALSADPGDLEAHWKLLRALHFEAEFTNAAPSEVWRVLEAGVAESDAALAVLALRAGARGLPLAAEPKALRKLYRAEFRAEAARIHFYTALVLGSWSQRSGVLRAVREGVARRLHDHARVVVAIDGRLEAGGGHRFLANLHARLPRVPFVTGWVDRSLALVEAERALAIAPDHPGNRLLAAMIRLDLGIGPPASPLEELQRIAELQPRPDEFAEDVAIRRAARERVREVGRQRAGN